MEREEKVRLLEERIIVFTGKFFFLSTNRIDILRQVVCHKKPFDHLI